MVHHCIASVHTTRSRDVATVQKHQFAGAGLPGAGAGGAAAALSGAAGAHGKLLPGPDDNSVILETDDGFTTLRVAGDDMEKVKDASGVAKAGKDAKDAKKACGCDCLPKGGPGE